ncbi:MAG: hypothetical protein EPO11_05620 [Gammaproteobacteria bacterium]|nr:MAG: hypothetical protein EPO11_05620 [Gammaproteobacteria bacterium]
MQRLCLLVLGLLLSFSTWADINLEPLLNRVTLQLHAEEWVTTKTALVSVGVNAAVTDQGIEKIQNDVLQQLKQLSAQADWHIVSFDRQLDKSGLETIQIAAQARLQQPELVNLRGKAKAMSKPGETFTIDNVQFIPSEEELRQANNDLRNSIYQQAKVEIEGLNKLYPDQKYYLHEIDFITSPPPPGPLMVAKMAVAAPLSVGNKQELQANVVLAAAPDILAQKVMAH